MRRGLGPEAAEEVAQECLTKLCEILPHFEYDRSKRGFRSYLRKLVHNMVIDLLRRKRPVGDPAEVVGDLEGGGSAEEEYIALEEQALALRCLELIRPELRGEHTYDVFCTRVIHGWPVEKICQEFGVTRTQVDGIKFRVATKLREKILELFGDRDEESQRTPEQA